MGEYSSHIKSHQNERRGQPFKTTQFVDRKSFGD